MKAIITGATGFIGRSLLKKIERPTVLTRDPEHARKLLGGIEAWRWDPEISPPPEEAFRGTEAVFHLAGEPVASGRWNARKKARILDSRVQGTRRLVEGLSALKSPPKVLVCASAVGIYGDRGDAELDETSSLGSDFLAQVCRAWEEEAARAASLGVRVVSVRIGLVLGAGGGALAKMLAPFKLGLGGRLGTGKQWMPWIHLEDLVGLMLHAAQRSEVSGPINGVAPAPVTNVEFTKTLGKVLRRPTLFPVPGLALRLAFGEFARMLLASQRVLPRVAQRVGYTFQYPALEGALRAVVER